MASRAELLEFHEAHYVDALADAVARGVASADVRTRYNLGTMECPIFPGLFDRARTTVGGAKLTARLAWDGRVAFFPAGGTHHGRPDRASGFCYFNDPVFAIMEFLSLGAKRVGYVDLDAHHGDGVEAAFCEDERVRLVSLHEADRWPGTGCADDTCDGRALNVPLPRGITDSEYRLIVERCVLPFLVAQELDCVVIVMGADGLKGDPLSAMQLSNSVLWEVVDRCVAMCPRAVVLGGGGYNPWTTARLWAGYWGRLSGRMMPYQMPDGAQAVLRGLESDLIDEEDRDPRWITRLVDPADERPVRPAVIDLVAAIAARFNRDQALMKR